MDGLSSVTEILDIDDNTVGYLSGTHNRKEDVVRISLSDNRGYEIFKDSEIKLDVLLSPTTVTTITNKITKAISLSDVNSIAVAMCVGDFVDKYRPKPPADNGIDIEQIIKNLRKCKVPNDSISKGNDINKFIKDTFDNVLVNDLNLYSEFVNVEVKAHFGVLSDTIKKIWNSYISHRKILLKAAQTNQSEYDDGDDETRFDAATCARMVHEQMPMFVMVDTLEFYIYNNGVFTNIGIRKTALPVRQLIRSIYRDECFDEDGKNGNDPSNEFISAVLSYIEDEYYISREDITNDSRYICLLNGVYDRVNKELLEHSPDYKFIRQIPVTYDAKATCPQIKKFISEIVDVENISVIYEALGYCLIPDTRIQKGILLNGVGANGKSTLLKLFRRFIGNDNCAQESLQALENDPYSTAELYGKMVNIYPDLASKIIYQNETIKQLIGDEGSIRARKIYCPPFHFKNTAKMVFSANRLPPVPNGDFAYFRRWILIDFPNKFTGDDKDDMIDAKIQNDTELSGLLNIVLVYLDKLIERGEYSYYLTTEQVEKLYKINSDPIAAFSDECLTYSEEGTPKMYIYEHYVKWCNDNSVEKVHPNPFSKRFSKLGWLPGRQPNGDRLHTWENCAIRESVQGEKISPDGKNQDEETNPSKRPRKNVHCYEGKNEKNLAFNNTRENKNNSGLETYRISSDETNGFVFTQLSTDNGISSVQGDFNSPDGYNKINANVKKTIDYCKDWETVYNKSINSTNYVSVVMEYCTKFKEHDVDSVTSVVKKYAKIPE